MKKKGKMASKILQFVGACFLVAVFIYSLYVQHVELLAEMYTSGFNQGRSQCQQTTVLPDKI